LLLNIPFQVLALFWGMEIERHHVQFFTAVCNDWLQLLESDEAKDIVVNALHYQVKVGHVKIAAFVIVPLSGSSVPLGPPQISASALSLTNLKICNKNLLILILSMSRKYLFGDSSELYFINFAVISWIDLFTREGYRKDYYCSSACDFYGKKGLIELIEL
jgi:hypothetical protein